MWGRRGMRASHPTLDIYDKGSSTPCDVLSCLYIQEKTWAPVGWNHLRLDALGSLDSFVGEVGILLNFWVTKGCFPFPVTSHIAGFLNSSFSKPKLRSFYGMMCGVHSYRKESRWSTNSAAQHPSETLQPSPLLSGLAPQHPHPHSPKSASANSTTLHTTMMEGEVPYLQWVWVQNVMRVWFFSPGFPS